MASDEEEMLAWTLGSRSQELPEHRPFTDGIDVATLRCPDF